MWNINRNDPQCLVLAADSRLVDLDYANDQIWEVLLGRGDPAAILLQTTYGLRARNMRVFPQFEEAHKIIGDPAAFAKPVEITQFTPNYLKMGFSPFPGIDVILEYWVPDCQTIAGRIRLENTSDLNRSVQMSICALLSPNNTEGQPMLPKRIEVANVLQGKTEDLSPVLFITGGAASTASPFPGLVHNLTLTPRQSRRFTWVLASLPEEEQSFRHARLTASQNFDSEFGQIEMINARQVEIYTGEKDWDLAFAMAKKTALSLIHSPTRQLKGSSFVANRLPDQGFSAQGNGIDYSHLWNGQTALETWYLIQFLLPGNANLAKDILLNFISIQKENGFIDFKPGLAGQRTNILAAPLLVSAAWKIYQTTQDLDFLGEVFRPLYRFVLAWFEPEQDRDGDGIPEWASPIQSGFDENPTFSPWYPWSQGADTTLVESPDLCAFLFRECQLLLAIARLLEKPEPVASLEAISDNLHRAVQSSWNGRRASFQYWDRETHQTRKGELLGKRKGPGSIPLDIVFELPARLLVRLKTQQTRPSKVKVTVHGRIVDGKTQKRIFQPEALSWQQGVCTLTLPDLYAEIEEIRVEGIPAESESSLSIIDHSMEDHTLLTPLWAGICTSDQVDTLLKRKLAEGKSFHKAHGIPACPKASSKTDGSMCEFLWLPWNMMAAEGLLNYGKTAEAAALFERLMKPIIHNLKNEQAFRRHYHAEQLRAAGQRNVLIGLPPVGLFLDILGIRPITPWKAEITHLNPFPWDIKIKYRGMLIDSTAKQVTITFPDGETITLSDQIPCQVAHKPSNSDSI